MLLTVRKTRSALPFCCEVKGARHKEGNTMREEESASEGIIELATVVTLHTFNGVPNWVVLKEKEVGKGFVCVGFNM